MPTTKIKYYEYIYKKRIKKLQIIFILIIKTKEAYKKYFLRLSVNKAYRTLIKNYSL